MPTRSDCKNTFLLDQDATDVADVKDDDLLIIETDTKDAYYCFSYDELKALNENGLLKNNPHIRSNWSSNPEKNSKILHLLQNFITSGDRSRDHENILTVLKQSDENIKEYFNKKDSNGDTVLLRLIKNEQSPFIIEILKDLPLSIRNEIINAQDDFGDTLLMNAAKVKDNTELIKFLILCGAKVDIQNKFGDTALMNAVQTPHNSETVQLLIKYSNVNLENKLGWSALMYAVTFNNVEYVKFLINHKSKVTQKIIDAAMSIELVNILNKM